MLGQRPIHLFAVFHEPPGNAVAFLRLNGRRVVELGEADAAALAALPATRLCAAFFSPQSHLDRHAFTLANKRLLALRVQRHIEDESLFPGAFRVRYRVSEASDAAICADLVAVPEEHINRIESLLPLRARPVAALVCVENALAALIARVSVEPTVVVWAQRGVLVGLLVQGGGVLTRRMERLAGDSPAMYREQAELLADSVVATARRLLHRDVDTVVLLGEAHEWCQGQTDRPALELKLEGLFDAAPGQVLRHAALFGLAFVDPAVNLLRADYRHTVYAHRLARPVAVLALAAGLSAAGAGMVALNRASALEQELAPRRAAMEQRMADVAARRPTAPQLEALRAWADLADRGHHALRLDRFMPWLSRAVPAGMRLMSVSVKPVAAPSRGRRPALPNGQYRVELIAESAGDFETTRRRSAALLQNLGGMLQLGETAFSYDPTGTAATHIKAIAGGENF